MTKKNPIVYNFFNARYIAEACAWHHATIGQRVTLKRVGGEWIVTVSWR